MRIQNKRALLLSVLIIITSLTCPVGSHAEMRISSIILGQSTTWSAENGPLVVTGEIQVPKGVTLTIAPGAQVDFTRGAITLLGGLIIGSASGPETTIKMGNVLVDRGSGSEITVSNTNLIGNENSQSILGAETNSITISNSRVSNLHTLINGQGARFFSIKNSTISNTINFGDCLMAPYFLEVTDNTFYNIENFCVPDYFMPPNDGSPLPKRVVTSNLFLNDSKNLNLHAPSLLTNFTSNYFASPAKLHIYPSYGYSIPNNYWSVTNEAALRANATIVDGFVDITLPKMNFSPMLQTPTGSTAIKFQVLSTEIQLKAAADKAAADKAAADKAAADKAAADAIIAKSAAETRKLDEQAQPLRLTVTQLLQKIAILLPKAATFPSQLNTLLQEKKYLEDMQNSTSAQIINSANIYLSNLSAGVSIIEQYLAKRSPLTITCIKGKIIKKITALNPVCPAGFRKKL